jgi:hypothetical protein
MDTVKMKRNGKFTKNLKILKFFQPKLFQQIKIDFLLFYQNLPR